MTDHVAEQEGEMEALQSIYVDDEFQLLTPSSFIINVAVESDHRNSEAENRVMLECRFSYPLTYPDVPVNYSIVERMKKLGSDDGSSTADSNDEDEENEDQDDADDAGEDASEIPDVLGDRMVDLFALLDEQIEENLGEAVVFTLVSSAKDWLDETVTSIRLERIRIEEEAALAKVEVVIEGTPCTEENFNVWKVAFDKEMREAGRLGFVEIEKQGGLTGVQQFLADKSLAESDLKMAESEPVTVE